MKLTQTLVLGALLLGGGYAAWHFTRPVDRQAPPPTPVPVTAAAASQLAVPIYLRTIGSVQPLNSVEIRAQATGVLLQVPVKEGDTVKKGQVLAVIDPRPFKAALDKAQAQLTQDKAQLANAELDRQRYSTLAKSNFASRQQLDTQVSTVNRLQGVVAADQASIDAAQIDLGYTVLKSPLDGLVGLRRVDPGNLIQANSTGPGIFLVVQEQPISVVFSLPETDLPKVRAAMAKGPLAVLANTADDRTTLGHGRLVTVNNAVDPSSGTIQLRADFGNPKLALTAGQFVSVLLQVGTAAGVAVPHLAIQHGQDGLFVFTVTPDKVVKRQDVKLAYDDGQHAVLANGVAVGTTVVVAGQSRIGDGIKVALNTDAAAPAPPKPQQSAER